MADGEKTTDGWRGRIGPQWSEREMLATALAFASEAIHNGMAAIGFDGRAGSRDMAMLTAGMLARRGVRCLVSADVVVTPAVGRFVAQHEDIDAGLIFTASHNPPGDVGLKVRGPDGLPWAQSSMSGRRESLDGLKEPMAVDDGVLTNRIQDHYLAVVRSSFVAAAAAFAGEVVMDTMHGAAGGLRQSDDGIRWRRAVVAPFFFGITPDPVLRERAEPEMISALKECARPGSAMVFMTDGDGDRLCLYTERSGYVASTELAIALIRAGLPFDRIISTHVAESALAAAAESRQITYETTSVGFKNIVRQWKAGGYAPALGVEPNGGIALAYGQGDYFERDGLATAELVLTTFPSARVLDDAVRDVRARRAFEAGQYPQLSVPERVRDRLRLSWPEFDESHHEGILRLSWPQGWRVLMRISGTEALTRCYVEGPAEMHEWFARRPAEAEISGEPDR